MRAGVGSPDTEKTRLDVSGSGQDDESVFDFDRNSHVSTCKQHPFARVDRSDDLRGRHSSDRRVRIESRVETVLRALLCEIERSEFHLLLEVGAAAKLSMFGRSRASRHSAGEATFRRAKRSSSS